MSGPAYPLAPAPGSNGIGLFIIGVSPIGTIPDFDVWRTVISQYANSPILTTLIENCFSYLDQTADYDAFFDLVINVETAQGWGLDVWGRRVGVSRVLQVPTQDTFGFEEAQPGSFGWGQGVFNAGTPITQNYALSDDAYRTLILVKAAANITNCSIPAINKILLALFPHRGNCYVTDGQQIGDGYFGFAESGTGQGWGQATFYDGESIATMTMTYTFDFELTPVEIAIVEQSGVLPKPTGVAASVVII